MSKNELLSKIGLRLDGRRSNELRRIRCKMGVFTKPNGSAYMEQGLTKVLAAVYGPHQMRNQNRGKAQHDNAVVNCQFNMTVFSTSERKKPQGDRKTAEMSLHLRQALLAVIKTDLYPWTQIDIYVEVLQADGGVYPACVNAATLALIDAGIPMKEYVVACTASLAKNGVAMVDISHQEESLGGPILTVAALPICGRFVLLEMSQRFHVDHLPKVLDQALQGCRDIQVIMDEIVKKHVEEMGQTTGWPNSQV